MLRSLVGSEMCIRDRKFIQWARENYQIPKKTKREFTYTHCFGDTVLIFWPNGLKFRNPILSTHTQSSPIQLPNLKTVSHRLFMNCGHICVVTPTRGNVGGTQFPIQFWRAALKLLNQGTAYGHGQSMAMDSPRGSRKLLNP